MSDSNPSQAVITRCVDGSWKMTIQSERQVEFQMFGTLEEIIKELKFAATKEWKRRERL